MPKAVFDYLEWLWQIVDAIARLLGFRYYRVQRPKWPLRLGVDMDIQLLLAGISATLQAVEVWLAVRDQRRAATTFETTLAARRDAPDTIAQAQTLIQLIPTEILDTFDARVRRCWSRYHDVLQGKYLPEEIDEATRAVRACICRELGRLQELNGSIPSGDLLNWWNAYCR